jgi:hypothetical protein
VGRAGLRSHVQVPARSPFAHAALMWEAGQGFAAFLGTTVQVEGHPDRLSWTPALTGVALLAAAALAVRRVIRHGGR